jgi:hypothetical protein
MSFHATTHSNWPLPNRVGLGSFAFVCVRAPLDRTPPHGGHADADGVGADAAVMML